jgi:hypothetical protein
MRCVSLWNFRKTSRIPTFRSSVDSYLNRYESVFASAYFERPVRRARCIGLAAPECEAAFRQMADVIQKVAQTKEKMRTASVCTDGSTRCASHQGENR